MRGYSRYISKWAFGIEDENRPDSLINLNCQLLVSIETAPYVFIETFDSVDGRRDTSSVAGDT